MACNRKSSATPLPCQQLAAARAQMALLVSGAAPTAIETPQLGRVEFYRPADAIAQLQRYIDQLAAQCAAAGGDPGTSGGMRRRPISIQAWP